MHDTQLELGVRTHCVNRIRKARQPVHHCDQDVLDSAVLQLRENPEPKPRPFAPIDSPPQKLLLALKRHRQGQVDRLLHHVPVVAHLHYDRVKKDDRVHRFKFPNPPYLRALHNPVGYRGNELRADFGAVDLLQVLGDLPVVIPRAYIDNILSLNPPNSR